MYTISREQIALGVKTGLDLLGPESEISVPVKMLDGCSLLKLLLTGISRGEIAISAVEQERPPMADITEVPLDQSEDEGD